MSIKSEPFAKRAQTSGYAIQPPRSSDIISGALRRAFETPDENDCDFSVILARIDQADRNRCGA